ncbi:MAG: hypothetical protein H5U00_10535 [Clostridia bacterium]|nr:hypothetical protein [Clostridia bacterium]
MRTPWNFRRGAIVAVVCGLVLAAAVAAARAVQPPVLVVDGRLVPCDPPPFVSGGRIFVPVRALGEVLGREVRWDAANRAVIVEEPSGGTDLAEALPPAEGRDDALSVARPASVGGVQYVRGFVINHRVSWVLDGKFKVLRFLYGASDAAMTPFEGPGEGRVCAEVLGDGKVLAEIWAEKGQSPKEVTVPVAGVKQVAVQRKWRHYHGGVVINPAAE